MKFNSLTIPPPTAQTKDIFPQCLVASSQVLDKQLPAFGIEFSFRKSLSKSALHSFTTQ